MARCKGSKTSDDTSGFRFRWQPQTLACPGPISGWRANSTSFISKSSLQEKRRAATDVSRLDGLAQEVDLRGARATILQKTQRFCVDLLLSVLPPRSGHRKVRRGCPQADRISACRRIHQVNAEPMGATFLVLANAYSRSQLTDDIAFWIEAKRSNLLSWVWEHSE